MNFVITLSKQLWIRRLLWQCYDDNRTDAWRTDVHLFFTITNCQIVPSRTLPHRINYKFRCLSAYEEKQGQAARTPNVVFVVASHYQSLQIVGLLLQACLLGSLALSGTLLLEQLQWIQQDRRFRLYTRVSSVVVWKQTVLQVAWGKGRVVFSSPFPLKRRFGDLFIL